MSNMKIELVSSGIRELLKSGEVLAECERVAGIVQSRYGRPSEISSYTGRTRVNVSISKDENDSTNDLIKALR